MNYTSEIMVKYQRNIVTKPIGDTADYVYYEDTIIKYVDGIVVETTENCGCTSVTNIEEVVNTIKPIDKYIVIDGDRYFICGLERGLADNNYDYMVQHGCHTWTRYDIDDADLIPVLLCIKEDSKMNYFYKNLNGEDIIIGRLFDFTNCINSEHYNLKELANHLNELMNKGFNIVPRNTMLRITDRVYVSSIPDWASGCADGTTQIVFSYTPTQEEYNVIKSIVDRHEDGLIDRYILDDVLGIDKFMI